MLLENTDIKPDASNSACTLVLTLWYTEQALQWAWQYFIGCLSGREFSLRLSALLLKLCRALPLSFCNVVWSLTLRPEFSALPVPLCWLFPVFGGLRWVAVPFRYLLQVIGMPFHWICGVKPICYASGNSWKLISFVRLSVRLAGYAVWVFSAKMPSGERTLYKYK